MVLTPCWASEIILWPVAKSEMLRAIILLRVLKSRFLGYYRAFRILRLQNCDDYRNGCWFPLWRFEFGILLMKVKGERGNPGTMFLQRAVWISYMDGWEDGGEGDDERRRRKLENNGWFYTCMKWSRCRPVRTWCTSRTMSVIIFKLYMPSMMRRLFLSSG